MNPERFVLSNRAWIHTKSSENHHKFVHHGHTNGNKKIHHKVLMRRTELNENKCPEGTRREGPPFPVNSRTKTQQSMAKIPNSREEREGTGRRRRAPGGRRRFDIQANRRERGRGVRGFLTPTTLNPKD